MQVAKVSTHQDFLAGGTHCLQRLYDEVVMFRGVYVGLRDGSKASRSTATSERKLWIIGHLVDVLLVPSWQDPGLLDRMLAARSVDDSVEGLVEHNKFNGALVFTHSLEYLFCCVTTVYPKAGLRSSILLWTWKIGRAHV